MELSRIGDSWVGGVKHLANEQGEQPQTDVLNPEDEGIGRTDDLGIYELGNGRPQRSWNQRERGTQHQNSGIGNDDTTYGITLEQR